MPKTATSPRTSRTDKSTPATKLRNDRPSRPSAKAVKRKNVLVLRVAGEERRGRRNPYFPNINIRATAAQMGVNESHLSRLLLKKTKPSLKMAKKLADLFGMSLEQVERIYDDGNGKSKQHFKINAA